MRKRVSAHLAGDSIAAQQGRRPAPTSHTSSKPRAVERRPLRIPEPTTNTHLEHDERRVVQLEERKGRRCPDALDGQRHLQGDVEQEHRRADKIRRSELVQRRTARDS